MIFGEWIENVIGLIRLYVCVVGVFFCNVCFRNRWSIFCDVIVWVFGIGSRFIRIFCFYKFLKICFEVKFFLVDQRGMLLVVVVFCLFFIESVVVLVIYWDQVVSVLLLWRGQRYINVELILGFDGSNFFIYFDKIGIVYFDKIVLVFVL